MNIPLEMFVELAFGSIFPQDISFTMRPLYDVTDDMLRFIRGNVSGHTFRFLVEHGMTAEYIEQWLAQRKPGP